MFDWTGFVGILVTDILLPGLFLSVLALLCADALLGKSRYERVLITHKGYCRESHQDGVLCPVYFITCELDGRLVYVDIDSVLYRKLKQGQMIDIVCREGRFTGIVWRLRLA